MNPILHPRLRYSAVIKVRTDQEAQNMRQTCDCIMSGKCQGFYVAVEQRAFERFIELSDQTIAMITQDPR